MDTQPAQNQENEITTEQKILKELVKLQKQYNLDQAEFKKFISWLYAYLIIATIQAILLIFFFISGGKL
jgi:ABC-type maltose transport system permease subunit